MRLAQRVERLFNIAWNKQGRPTIKVIRPVSEWELPNGYTYDESADVIRDDSDAIVSDPSAYQTYDTVPVMSGGIEFTMRGQQDQNIVLTNAGMASNAVLVMRTLPAYADILKAAFAVEVDGLLYDMNGANVLPEGTSESAWVNVTLKRR